MTTIKINYEDPFTRKQTSTTLTRLEQRVLEEYRHYKDVPSWGDSKSRIIRTFTHILRSIEQSDLDFKAKEYVMYTASEEIFSRAYRSK